jgi:hypothetical protein
LAAPTDDTFAAAVEVVTSRPADVATLDYGRATPAEFWQREQLEHAPGNTPGAFDPVRGAYNWSKGLVVGAWDWTTGLFTNDGSAGNSQVAYSPARYGRAGGFEGLDQFNVPQPGVTMLPDAPDNAVAIKSGEAQVYAADAGGDSQSAAPDYTQDKDQSLIEQNAEKDIILERPGEPAQVPAASSDASGQSGGAVSGQSGDASATDNSGYTEHKDPENTPNSAMPSDATGDASATDNSGYTEHTDPEDTPNSAMPSDATGDASSAGDTHNVHGADTGMSSEGNQADPNVGDMQHSDGQRFDKPEGQQGQSELPQQQ